MNRKLRKTAATVLAAAMCGSLAGVMPAVAAGNPLGTYECETMEGVDQVWTSVYETQLPDCSGEGFAYLSNAPISIDIEIEEEGMYQVDVRAAQVLSPEGRMQTISVNGIDYTYQMPYLDKWTDVTFGVFRMKKGTNTLTLKPMYGYAEYDTITISKAELPEVKCSDTPVDPKATPETKALMKYLASEYGKHILSGQQEIYGGGHGVQTDIRYDAEKDICVDGKGKEYTIDKDSYDKDEQGNKFPWHCMDETGFVYTYSSQNRNYAYNDYDTECRYLYELTGHYPAIRGFDLNTHNPGYFWEDGVTDRMIDWAKNKNGICTISWHCCVPTQMADFEVKDGEITKISGDWQQFTYSEKTDFMPSNIFKKGTKEQVFYDTAIEMAATELLKLQEAGVPVIFRPLHEAEGNPAPEGQVSGSWFWWGKEGAEVYNQVWKYLYDKLTNEYGVHNLIWEQNLYAWSDKSLAWYTGDEYVDMVGFDKYNTVYNRHDGGETGTPNEDAESKIFWQLVDFVKNGKMVSMPENSTIPSIDNLLIEQAKWSYFCTWYDDGDKFISGENYQNADTVKDIFQSDYCITLDELPEDLYKFDGTVTPTEPKATETTAPKPTETTKPTPTETTKPEPTNPTTVDGDIIIGDVNNDSKIDIMDVIALNKFLLGSAELDANAQKRADTDASGQLDGNDSLNLLKRVLEIIKELPVKPEA